MRPQALVNLTLALVLLVGTHSLQGQQPGSLNGTVSSQAEGPMEGVLVSAKALGSTITTTVVSDAQGRYAFPEGRLQPGRYRISIRAAGYDLVEPGVVLVAENAPTKLDLRLQETQNLAAQLMNAEWQFSLPGDPLDKARFAGCVGCHSLTTPVQTRYDPQQFAQVVRRMSGYSTGSGLLRPTQSYARRMNPIDGTEPVDEESTAFASAKYLASINLSQHPTGERPYALKPFPRPSGRATNVIITEYDLPRPEMQPHDVMTDSEGYAWFGDFGDNVLSRLDPTTGEIKQWRWPLLRPEQPAGNLDLRIDNEGGIWMGLLRQGGIARFDMKTETFETYEIPAEMAPGTNVGQVVFSWDGSMVWIKSSPDRKVLGFDVKQRKFTKAYEVPDVMYYGMTVDQNDILYLYGIESHTIGELNLKTGEFVEYPTPTSPSAPRRGDMDAQQRPWFAFNTTPGGVGMYDPKTNQTTEYWFDTPYEELYDATVDKDTGEVYAGGMLSDYVYRLDPRTGDYIRYLLPTLNVNIRRMHNDTSKNPVQVWIGYNHQAKVARLEPLD